MKHAEKPQNQESELKGALSSKLLQSLSLELGTGRLQLEPLLTAKKGVHRDEHHDYVESQAA